MFIIMKEHVIWSLCVAHFCGVSLLVVLVYTVRLFLKCTKVLVTSWDLLTISLTLGDDKE